MVCGGIKNSVVQEMHAYQFEGNADVLRKSTGWPTSQLTERKACNRSRLNDVWTTTYLLDTEEIMSKLLLPREEVRREMLAGRWLK
jgi:hypothetical protein